MVALGAHNLGSAAVATFTAFEHLYMATAVNETESMYQTLSPKLFSTE